MGKNSFDVSDLKRWQKQGIISEQQLETIIKQENIEIKPAAEKKSGWNLITVLYYFGGFLALLSFTLFIGMSWDDFSQWARFAVALIALVVIGGLGLWLRFFQKFETAGGLLLFVATAILPLLVYTVASLTGFWAEGARSTNQDSPFLLWDWSALPEQLRLHTTPLPANRLVGSHIYPSDLN